MNYGNLVDVFDAASQRNCPGNSPRGHDLVASIVLDRVDGTEFFVLFGMVPADGQVLNSGMSKS